MRHREWLGYVLGIIGVFIFAGTLPATRLAVSELDPWFVTFGRAAGAGIAALAVLIVLRRPWPSQRQIKLLSIAAPNVLITFPLFVALAMQSVPASHGGVVLGILPLVTAAIGALWNGNRPPLRFWLLSLAAACVVIAYSLRESGWHLSWGDGLLFIAALCASLAYVASAEASQGMPGWEVISWICAGGLPITLALAVWFWPPNVAAASAAAWLSFGYVALFSQFIGFFAWNAGLAIGGVAKISQVQYLQTFFTIGIAALVNNETIGFDTLIVASLVVALLLLGRRALGGR